LNHDLMLAYLGASYFHQDYDADGLSPLETVRDFAESEGLQTVQIFYVELAELLAGAIDEEGARKLWMDDAHSMYDPLYKDGVSHLQWLRSVLLTVGSVLRQRWLTPRASLHE
jgi:hypothetical protein